MVRFPIYTRIILNCVLFIFANSAVAQGGYYFSIPSDLIRPEIITSHWDNFPTHQYQLPAIVSTDDGTVVFGGDEFRSVLALYRIGSPVQRTANMLELFISGRVRRNQSEGLHGILALSAFGSMVGTRSGARRVFDSTSSTRSFRSRSPDYLVIPGIFGFGSGVIVVDFIGPRFDSSFRIHMTTGRLIIIGRNDDRFLALMLSQTAAIGISESRIGVFDDARFRALRERLEIAGFYRPQVDASVIKLFSKS